MIKRTYEELEPYFPAGHFGVTTAVLTGPTTTTPWRRSTSSWMAR